MEQPAKKRRLISPRMGTILGIIVIAIAVYGVLRSGPHEVEHDSLFAPPPTPTVVVTNPVASTDLHQKYTYNGVNITFTKAELASKFSDDFKPGGTYVVRVSLNTTNNNSDTIGVDYVSLTRLILPSGQSVKGKVASINAAVYPGKPQSGYIDFPVNDKIDLSQLKLQFDKTVLS
ncbi:hypothetical protein [Dictyobacter aurantiacus]|uniref:DUF4352 domain-containing protein n=1 Tax=Dictyobacter aurantiacus TaxID=1936993 RepID=A0A401Z8H8_9CHLR|nr:hypothetical protein [Dictyobacter aurantiacus]GCE03118.1 hypothetical protein KDAU_04470 [Dictyobacter aurantiacus]